MPRVLVTPSLLQRQPGPYLDVLTAGGFEVAYVPEGVDTLRPGAMAPLLRGVDAVLASTEPYPREVLAGANLRVIARMGVGYDSVDIPAATERGVAVTITPGTLEDSVAEHTFALLLALTRGVLEREREVRRGVWTRKPLPRLAGKVFGVVGLGRIGKAVAQVALGFKTRVVAHDPFPDAAFAARHGIRLLDLDDLLAEADVVSLHLPTNKGTTDLFNARTLRRMKRGAILVNTARGGVVDEAALVDSLRSGHLGGAALDVFKQEPLPLDSPLLELDNVVLCTHTGGVDEESQVACSRLAAECIVHLSRGHWPEGCVVNHELRGQWRW